MKKNYKLLLLVCLGLFNLAKAQLPPILGPIKGPSTVCSMPASPKSYTASATNASANSYNWFCYGGSGATITNPNSAVATIGFQYSNMSATYTLYCIATNIAGSSNTSSFVVTVYEAPSVTFSGSHIFCQGSSTNLSASPTIYSSSSTLTYSWSPAIGLSSTTSYSVKANPPTTTNYTLSLSLGSCKSEAKVTVFVNICNGIAANELTENQGIQSYPNPNKGSFIIKSDQDAIATIINELGQTIQTVSLIAEEKTSITGLKPGIYFILSANTRRKIVVTD